jgi:plasmid stabilization system protein ParE
MSAKRVEYHDGATADVKNAVAWYQKHSAKAALDFVEELHRAADTIRECPERWPQGRNNTRRFLLWRFPFSIIYSEHQSAITIWAVAHGSRRPEYWARRLK